MSIAYQSMKWVDPTNFISPEVRDYCSLAYPQEDSDTQRPSNRVPSTTYNFTSRLLAQPHPVRQS